MRLVADQTSQISEIEENIQNEIQREKRNLKNEQSGLPWWHSG